MSRSSFSLWFRLVASILLPLLTPSCTERTPFATSDPAESVPPTAALVAPAPSLTCTPGNGGITLPPGFCAIVVADQVGFARHVTTRPNGDVYIALKRAPAGQGTDPGGILALRDDNGDGKADRKVRFGTLGGTGIGWYNGSLYFAPNDRVLRYTIAASSLVPSSSAVTIVSGLPKGGHQAKNITFGAPWMYVNIASGSNSCQVQNRVRESPGKDPCPELATRAGVWRFDPTRTGQVRANGVRFATGLRDMLALAINPADGALYGVQHDLDQLGMNWPKLFTMAQDARIPAEEFMRIAQGDDFGWPYCYHDGIQKKKVLSPEYGGNGTLVGRCSTKKLPQLAFPAHWAPMSMVFYTGTKQFPAKYAGGAFVAFHGDQYAGSRRRPDNPGYLVAFVPFVNGAPTGYEIFASGFIGTGSATPSKANHRATGLAVGPDGSLYITDDKAGRIWRVIYRGP